MVTPDTQRFFAGLRAVLVFVLAAFFFKPDMICASFGVLIGLVRMRELAYGAAAWLAMWINGLPNGGHGTVADRQGG